MSDGVDELRGMDEVDGEDGGLFCGYVRLGKVSMQFLRRDINRAILSFLISSTSLRSHLTCRSNSSDVNSDRLCHYSEVVPCSSQCPGRVCHGVVGFLFCWFCDADLSGEVRVSSL